MTCPGPKGIEVDPVGVHGVNGPLFLGWATVVEPVIAPKITASRGLCFVEEAFEHLD